MSTSATVGLALIVAVLVLWAASKPVRKAVRGVISTDRKGRTTLVVWPSGKRRKRKRK